MYNFVFNHHVTWETNSPFPLNRSPFSLLSQVLDSEVALKG